MALLEDGDKESQIKIYDEVDNLFGQILMICLERYARVWDADPVENETQFPGPV